MFHMANGAGMYSLFVSGGTSVVIKAFTPEAVFDAIEQQKVTDTTLVPTMIQMMADHPAVRLRDLGSLERILYGGSPISEAVLDRASAALPGVASYKPTPSRSCLRLPPFCTRASISATGALGDAIARAGGRRSVSKSGSSTRTIGRCRAARSVKSAPGATWS
jgi:acyl-CoA synthetase (AMP-forming)/AMP-acid ligase II